MLEVLNQQPVARRPPADIHDHVAERADAERLLFSAAVLSKSERASRKEYGVSADRSGKAFLEALRRSVMDSKILSDALRSVSRPCWTL